MPRRRSRGGPCRATRRAPPRGGAGTRPPRSTFRRCTEPSAAGSLKHAVRFPCKAAGLNGRMGRPLPLEGTVAQQGVLPSSSLARDPGSTGFFFRPLPFEGIVAQREDFAVRFPCKGSGFNRGICRPLPLEGIVQGNSNGLMGWPKVIRLAIQCVKIKVDVWMKSD